MNQDLTLIAVVLDRSGSMHSVAADTIGGFNAFIAAQKALPGAAVLTLAQFNTSYELTHDAVPIDLVPDLTAATYQPGGGTALYDAIGRTILATRARVAAMPEDKRPAKTLFVIMTDGQENQSSEFTSKDKIHALVTEQREKHASEFLFIGADINAMSEGVSLGVSCSNAVQYEATPAGTRALMGEVSRGVESYRTSDGAAKDDVLGRGSK